MDPGRQGRLSIENRRDDDEGALRRENKRSPRRSLPSFHACFVWKKLNGALGACSLPTLGGWVQKRAWGQVVLRTCIAMRLGADRPGEKHASEYGLFERFAGTNDATGFDQYLWQVVAVVDLGRPKVQGQLSTDTYQRASHSPRISLRGPPLRSLRNWTGHAEQWRD